MTVLLVGDDWAADHHDVELMDQAGRVLARARLSEGAAGMARLDALVGDHAGDGDGEDELGVRAGIETGHGPWVMALAAAGYAVFAVNPLQAARYRDRHAVPGAKSDTGDGHILADMARTGAHQLRPVAAATHEALDAHPHRRAADYLRHILTAAGTLPPRDEELARTERWLAGLLARAGDPASRRLVQSFATWQVMRRLRRSTAASTRPRSPTAHARNQIKAAAGFLAWLASRGQSLAGAATLTSTTGSPPARAPGKYAAS